MQQREIARQNFDISFDQLSTTIPRHDKEHETLHVIPGGKWILLLLIYARLRYLKATEDTRG